MFFHVTKRARFAIFAISIVDNLCLLQQQMEHNKSTIAAMNHQHAMRIKFHDHYIDFFIMQSQKTLAVARGYFGSWGRTLVAVAIVEWFKQEPVVVFILEPK